MCKISLDQILIRNELKAGDIGYVIYLHSSLYAREYGFGLGSKLIGQCIDSIRERGFMKAFLWTTHELTTAARLYTSAGFRLTEEKESMAFGKPVRERRYDLLLQET